jgi:hypothetical protein
MPLEGMPHLLRRRNRDNVTLIRDERERAAGKSRDRFQPDPFLDTLAIGGDMSEVKLNWTSLARLPKGRVW